MNKSLSMIRDEKNQIRDKHPGSATEARILISGYKIGSALEMLVIDCARFRTVISLSFFTDWKLSL
jgi:hypothetical protein